MKCSLIVLIISLNSILFAKEIALSFDDAPTRDKNYYPGKQRADKMIKSLKKVGVKQAVFFSNPGKIQKDKEKYERLIKYHQAGHLVGNHTYSHKDADKVSVEEFRDDFLKADLYLEKMGIRAKYFRYPYLHRGKSKKIQDEIRKQILALGYIDGYVTVDTYDWYLDSLYQSALSQKREINYTNLKRLYLDAIMGAVNFYHKLSQDKLKKDVKHVLLLHENDLAALFIEELVLQLKLDGWKIINAEDAYKDKTLTPYPKTDFHGQGRVAAILHAQGVQGPFRSDYESENKLKKMFIEYGVML